LHDNDKSKDQHLLPFDGTIDWKFYEERLKESNYLGDVTLESCYRNDYLKYSLEEFYRLAFERAKQLDI
jgi:sugar phosphate isomerase/epimerase